MMRNYTLLFGIMLGVGSFLNASSLPLSVSNRVDTTNSEIRKIVELYANYLNSNPEKIYDNPYWNSREKIVYTDFDLSREALFGSLTAKELQRYYTPFVLSVDAIGKKYTIRVLYSSNTTDSQYIGSKVWAIHRLFATKENNKWVLENSLPNITSNWKSTKNGHLNFIYPTEHAFSNLQADKAAFFCNSILERFNPDYNEEHFNYYITNSVDEMGKLENFDFYFAGVTSGKSKEGMVFSANGNEFYPHEFVHQLLPKNSKRSNIIEEGLATYLGTRENRMAYYKTMSQLALDLEENNSINFNSIFSKKVQFNGYQLAYPAGAAVCELVYQRKGDEGINKLIRGDSSDKKALLHLLSVILTLDEEEIINQWETTVLTYKNY